MNLFQRESSREVDNLQRENKQLKSKLELLERENKALKLSIYELSIRYNALYQSAGVKAQPFSLDSVVDDASLDLPSDILENVRHVNEVDEVDTGGVRTSGRFDSRTFSHRMDIRAHKGAVYVARFSPCGRWLASGSFDKTARLHSLEGDRATELFCLSEHQHIVSEIAWTPSSSLMLSGGYDKRCCLWDVATGKLVQAFEVPGFVQSLSFAPQDNNLVFSATSSCNFVGLHDLRAGAACQSRLENDSTINSIFLSKDGMFLTSGDQSGHIKLWDCRQGLSTESRKNDEVGKPISYLHTSSMPCVDDDGRYIAANSYDNVLRVYDRGMQPAASASQRALNQTHRAPLTLMHSLRGHKNRNWPIRSSFFHGREHRATGKWHSSSKDSSGVPGSADDDVKGGPAQDASIHTTVLLATGSADPNAYIFDVGGPAGTGELIQKLEHPDRVYSTYFHPTEPTLVTACADFVIRVFGPSAPA
eukprot:tig00020554_g10834.t1